MQDLIVETNSDKFYENTMYVSLNNCSHTRFQVFMCVCMNSIKLGCLCSTYHCSTIVWYTYLLTNNHKACWWAEQSTAEMFVFFNRKTAPVCILVSCHVEKRIFLLPVCYLWQLIQSKAVVSSLIPLVSQCFSLFQIILQLAKMFRNEMPTTSILTVLV